MLRQVLVAVYIVLLMSLSPQFALAQKVASYDYTDEKPRERLRPPLPPPPPPAIGPINGPLHSPPVPAGSIRGVCGGVLGEALLAATLTLDRDSYTVGDEFTFTLRLEAVKSVWVPVRPSIADVEPSDPLRSYKYRPMYIGMELDTADHKRAGMTLLTLYGSPDTPGSEILLKRGQWVQIRANRRMQFQWSDPALSSSSAIPRQFSAIAIALRQGSFSYDATTKQEDQLCDFSAEQSAVGLPAHFTLSANPSP